jgi:hypothetical protein
MLLLARQTTTLAQLAANATDPGVEEHLEGLLRLIWELERSILKHP